MSTQDGSGIPFRVCNEQQNLRLLELPPALLEMVTDRSLSILEFKSAVPHPSSGLTQTSANAVLCTDNQTYQVRQVQSSNSVFILQPSESNDASSDESIPPTSISAIAQCPVTLELVSTSPFPATSLKQSIPAFLGSESIPVSKSMETISRRSVLGSSPFSLGEFNNAWKQLCCFELDGQAWLPAASSLVNIWKSIVSAAAVRSVSLEGSFPIDALGGIIEGDGHPSNLFRAVVNRLGSENEDTVDGYAVFNKEFTVLWVGLALLECLQTSANGISLSEFMQEWQNNLPEAWRPSARLDTLQGKYTLLPNDRIVLNTETIQTTNPKDTKPAAASTKNSRKWHEKFRNARP